MKFRTVKAVRAELPEYAPHLSMNEQGWPHNIWTKDELLEWVQTVL
jgi:hypothetical protein